MDLFKNQGVFLTDKGYSVFHESNMERALLQYGIVLIEFSELAENMDKFKNQMLGFAGSGEKVTPEAIHDYMRYFREQLACFAPLIAEDWLDYILYSDLQKGLQKAVGERTFLEITDKAAEGFLRFSTLSSKLLQILEVKDASPEDEEFFINTFKHQVLKTRFEKNSISGSADLLFLVEDFYSFIALEAHAVKKYKVTVKPCRNCDKWFIADKSDTQTCDRISPQYPDKTCKEAAKHLIRLKRENSNEAFKLYKSIYTTKLARYNAAKESGDTILADQLEKEVYEGFTHVATQFKADIKNGTRTEEEYIEWLRTFKRNKSI